MINNIFKGIFKILNIMKGEVIGVVRETFHRSAADETREVFEIMDGLEERLENHACIVSAQVFER